MGVKKKAFLGLVSLKVSLLGSVGGLPDPTRTPICDYSQIAPEREPRQEKIRSSCFFWTKWVKAGLPDGIVLHSYRYAWAERAQAAGMPEREAMAHLGHGSKAVIEALLFEASVDHKIDPDVSDRLEQKIDYLIERIEMMT